MKRLSGLDSMFLSLETPRWPMHVAGLTVLDPREAPGFGFEQVRDSFAERIGRVPKMMWKLKEVPWGLDRPVWVEDRDFDVDRHFERVAVKAPGGRRELADLVGELMPGLLDRRLPLWKTWYVDGLAGGKVGLISKQHHCLMDGAVGTSLMEVLMDVEPNPVSVPTDVSARTPLREPSELELLLRSGIDLVATPARAVGYLAAVARGFGKVRPQLVKNGVASVPALPPATSFNDVVGWRRGLSFLSLSLADVKAVRKSLGVTVNDVVVGLCAGLWCAILPRWAKPCPPKR